MQEETGYGIKDIPPMPEFMKGMDRAPSRGYDLSKKETEIAVRNALRYIPRQYHEMMAPEFLGELIERGRIYGYRFRPEGAIRAKSVNEYGGKTLQGKAVQLMIDNNLDFDVALFPYELVTYGSTGQVCQNWMQYRLIRRYLEELTDEQTLVVFSGHPLGLFPSRKEAPRVIMTNGLLVGEYDNQKGFNKAAALGVTNYGQMTAGGWMYIGPQGIVHGTYITLLNAGRRYIGMGPKDTLGGRLFITSGLGGMSGAQAKAVEIAGGIGVIAEVNDRQTFKRHEQGWISLVSDDLDEIFGWVERHRATKEPVSIAYRGNIVDLWQYCVDNNIQVDLGSDQTSCHAVYDGGYTPDCLTYEEAIGGPNGPGLMESDPERFRKMVDASLVRQYGLISTMRERGMFFWDYGNSFLKAVYDAGSKDIARNPDNPAEGFIFPSYIEDLMGPMVFDLGFGPFRWICLSCDPKDLERTDRAAMECIDPDRSPQDFDNHRWISEAGKNRLVVGSQARILYQDAHGRVKIALKFNEMVRKGQVGPIMMGRDHHDPGGTDSPYRETANIKDGSNVTADMSAHCFAGNVARGMTMVVLSNGGGVGIGKVQNSGYGLVLDGSDYVDSVIKSALEWDVMVGVGRRSWSGNENSMKVVSEWNDENGDRGHITEPIMADDRLLRELLEE
ncbi:MAG: urocanate hydratase [Candidatus Thermoplasmatota archaeon]|nr:urocanate hydratase [Candidatus Thermoplasmatota archaeon]